MYEEKVGIVTENEKQIVLGLHERKIALDELLITIGHEIISSADNSELYEKVVKDLGKTKMKIQNWWDDMEKKYNWKKVENGSWNIDFLKNEIILVYPDNFEKDKI